MDGLGKVLIVAGVLLATLGVVLHVSGRIPTFGLGRLPGDIRIDRDGFQFYLPITTCILISVVLTGVFYLISKLR